METLSIEPWLLKHDKHATALAYAQIQSGAAEGCACDYCLNFVAARENIYPLEVQAMLEQLGVDYKKELELFWCNKEETGLHCYAGEFHFVGYLVDNDHAGNCPDSEAVALNFENEAQNFIWRFSDKVIRPNKAFAGKALVAFHYAIRIPWVLKQTEPE
jgi:hypothetical protein